VSGARALRLQVSIEGVQYPEHLVDDVSGRYDPHEAAARVHNGQATDLVGAEAVYGLDGGLVAAHHIQPGGHPVSYCRIPRSVLQPADDVLDAHDADEEAVLHDGQPRDTPKSHGLLGLPHGVCRMDGDHRSGHNLLHPKLVHKFLYLR